MSEDAERPRDARELCAYLVRGLVDAPDQVAVREEEREDARRARGAPSRQDDRGKVIGKGGRIVRALRTVRAGRLGPQRPQDDGRDRGVAAWPIRGAPRACGSARSGGRTACTAPSTSAAPCGWWDFAAGSTLLVDGDERRVADRWPATPSGPIVRARRRRTTARTPPRCSAPRSSCRARRVPEPEEDSWFRFDLVGCEVFAGERRARPGRARSRTAWRTTSCVLDDAAGDAHPVRRASSCPASTCPGARLEVGRVARRGGRRSDRARHRRLHALPELVRRGSPRSATCRTRSPGRCGSRFHNLRDHSPLPHRMVDDEPYGGGAGMLMRVDCVVAALEGAFGAPLDERARGAAHRRRSTPAAAAFDDAVAREYAAGPGPRAAGRPLRGLRPPRARPRGDRGAVARPVRAQRRRGRRRWRSSTRVARFLRGLARRRRLERGGVVLAGARRRCSSTRTTRGRRATAAGSVPEVLLSGHHGRDRRVASRAGRGAHPAAPRRRTRRTDGRARTMLVRFAAG